MIEQPRPYTVVQVGDDEYEVVSTDGRFAARMTAAELAELERAAARGPLPLDLP